MKHLKLKQLFIAGLLIIASTPAFASTVQQPASTVIEAKPDGKGNVIISWTGETRPFTRLERYIGHGRKTGHVAGILIPAGTHQAILKNVKGDGDDSSRRLYIVSGLTCRFRPANIYIWSVAATQPLLSPHSRACT